MGYRENFFKANKPQNGKYECAYCGEKLNAVRNLIRKRLTLDTLPSNHAEAATA